jgi:hypothetical protein
MGRIKGEEKGKVQLGSGTYLTSLNCLRYFCQKVLNRLMGSAAEGRYFILHCPFCFVKNLLLG